MDFRRRNGAALAQPGKQAVDDQCRSPWLLPILLPRWRTTSAAHGQLWNIDPALGPQWMVLDEVPTTTDQMLPCPLCVSSCRPYWPTRTSRPGG